MLLALVELPGVNIGRPGAFPIVSFYRPVQAGLAAAKLSRRLKPRRVAVGKSKMDETVSCPQVTAGRGRGAGWRGVENRDINLSRVADTAGCDVVRFVKCTPTRDREAGYIKELEGASEKFHRSCSMRGGLAVEVQSSLTRSMLNYLSQTSRTRAFRVPMPSPPAPEI